jgi:transposase-like protein
MDNEKMLNPVCLECNQKMHKSGYIWSGRHKVQRYKCNKCGRTTVKIDINQKGRDRTNG